MNLLINNQKITANELAEKLEVSKRTIYRDIEDLNMAGIPVVSFPGQGGGLGILDNYKIDKKFFSIYELEQIIIGLNALKSLDISTNISTLISKLDTENTSKVFENIDTLIDLSAWFKSDYLKNDLYKFKEAIGNKKLATIEYQSEKGFSKRKVEPYRIIFKHSSWYLYAFCLEKKDYRLFKMDRIIFAEILDISFVEREFILNDIESIFENDLFKKKEEKCKFQVTLEYKKENEKFLTNKIGNQVFKFDTQNKTITFVSSNYSWLIEFIISLNDKVKVIEPIQLAEDIKVIIENMNKLYKQS